jgi:hypothetical protein
LGKARAALMPPPNLIMVAVVPLDFLFAILPPLQLSMVFKIV